MKKTGRWVVNKNGDMVYQEPTPLWLKISFLAGLVAFCFAIKHFGAVAAIPFTLGAWVWRSGRK